MRRITPSVFLMALVTSPRRDHRILLETAGRVRTAR